MTAEICYLSATELVARYRARELSPVEVTRAVLARIAALNPKVNAYCLVDPEHALADARAAEARWLKGEPAGPIDGVPTSIKDLLLTRDWPTLRGSKTIDPAGPWLDDAPATARLRANGAVLLGKTTTPEYGWKGVTDSPLTGVTRSPWRLDRTPGGSSGGAAAQLAAGMGHLAVGTDAGGSIRVPASFTGTTGLKANFGRVPAWPLSPLGTLAHVGPMARTIADCALLLNVLAQPDVRDWQALPYDGRDWTRNLDAGVKGLRIAFSARLGYVRYVHPDVDARVTQAASVFQDLGARVDRIDPGFADCLDTFLVHWRAGVFNALRALPRASFENLEPALKRAYEASAGGSLALYLDAVEARGLLGQRMKRFHEQWDLLITPTVAVPPFELERLAPPDPRMSEDDWFWWIPFTYPFNLTQQPAASIPCGLSWEGLPIGLQIVGPNHREDLVLRAAHAFQQATRHHLGRPGGV
jgi:aspartyl-tRNA(Asn)/glutamyl-tRNA(Gln) amidotransferase subunit A